jgi:hypothetical protein
MPDISYEEGVRILAAFDAAWSRVPDEGWLTREEGMALWAAANLPAAASGRILEVGSYFGRSTVLLAALGRMIYSVDPFDGFHSDLSGDYIAEQFINNLRTRSIFNVTQFRQRVEDWMRTPLPCSFAYLDGDHTTEGTIAQIDAALACGARVIAIHDYSESGGGMLVVAGVHSRPQLVLVNRVGTMAICEVRE